MGLAAVPHRGALHGPEWQMMAVCSARANRELRPKQTPEKDSMSAYQAAIFGSSP